MVPVVFAGGEHRPSLLGSDGSRARKQAPLGRGA